ncbi:MAG: hypothetical protein LBQ81_00820 [Zoogloeaceae bacterium]|jgi:hypothetical protein|nr:hypothetical protein [Zoogloeaceae bacterium]
MHWRFVDKALFFSPWEAILTLKAGSLEEYSLLERWGEPRRAPALLLLETCVQSARWLIEASSGFSLSGDPVEITRWNALPGLRPGERFCAGLRVVTRDAGHIRFSLRQKILAPAEEAPSAQTWQGTTENDDDGSLICAFTPLEPRHLPADRACLWQEMRA